MQTGKGKSLPVSPLVLLKEWKTEEIDDGISEKLCEYYFMASLVVISEDIKLFNQWRMANANNSISGLPPSELESDYPSLYLYRRDRVLLEVSNILRKQVVASLSKHAVKRILEEFNYNNPNSADWFEQQGMFSSP